MKGLKSFAGTVAVALRQREYNRVFQHLIHVDPNDTHALAESFRKLSKVFAKYSDPASWTGHVWLQDYEQGIASTLYGAWTKGEWAFVEGVAKPPKREPPTFVLPISSMIQ